MPVEPGILAETVLQKLRHQAFGVGQRGDTVTKITWWENTHLPPQSSRTAAVIGYGDDGGNVVGVFFEAAQKRV